MARYRSTLDGQATRRSCSCDVVPGVALTMIAGFNFAASPHLHFGAGKHKVLPDLVRSFGSNILLITGASSFRSSVVGQQLINKLQASGSVENHIINNEPTQIGRAHV